LTASSKSTFNIGLLYKVNKDLSLASSTTHSSDKMCDVLAIGGSYAAPQIGVIKAKYAGSGLLSLCVTRELAPKVMLTASGSVSASDLSTFKPGFTLSI
jgi:voltage-dependent anion channel protein 2